VDVAKMWPNVSLLYMHPHRWVKYQSPWTVE